MHALIYYYLGTDLVAAPILAQAVQPDPLPLDAAAAAAAIEAVPNDGAAAAVVDDLLPPQDAETIAAAAAAAAAGVIASSAVDKPPTTPAAAAIGAATGSGGIYELYTSAIGVYLCLLIIRGTTLATGWIQQGWAQMSEKMKDWAYIVSFNNKKKSTFTEI